MSIVNLLCTYYLHGLDGAENDFLNIKTKVEETFNVLFNISKENNNVVNLHYGYCSKDNERKKSHAEFGKLVEISFKELNKFLEDIVLDNFKENTKEKINVDQVQCHVYFSIVGHSLGGLILKGVVKSIFSKFEKDEIQYENYFEYLKQKYSFIHDIQPCSFITLSSPHLGTMTSHESGGISKRFMKFGSKFFCRYLSGPIGKIFMYEDATKDHEKPILIQLCEKEYMTTYEKFPNRTLVACIRHDIPVKYSSAMGDLEMPLYEYQEKHLLIEKDQADTKILSYSGYESEALKYYQKELFNEVISKDMYVSDTLYLPLPNIDEQIKKGLEKLNLKENVDSIKESYEEMNDVFISDTINQTVTSVAALKLFNQIGYRRIAIDFNLPKFSRFSTHPVYMGDIIIKTNPTIESMVGKTVKLFSNIILADYLRTSKQDTIYSLHDLVN